MPSWLCVKCLHEFPDSPTVKRQPELVGMIIFLTIGIALLLFALACIYVATYAYAALALLSGLATIAFAFQLKTGLKTICPACGKPQGIPAHTKSADEIRRNAQKKHP